VGFFTFGSKGKRTGGGIIGRQPVTQEIPLGAFPIIYSGPPRSPYSYTSDGLVNVGVGSGNEVFHLGQVTAPYNPWPKFRLPAASINPCEGAGIAAATVTDVSILGNGGELFLGIVQQSLIQPNVNTAGLFS